MIAKTTKYSFIICNKYIGWMYVFKGHAIVGKAVYALILLGWRKIILYLYKEIQELSPILAVVQYKQEIRWHTRSTLLTHTRLFQY